MISFLNPIVNPRPNPCPISFSLYNSRIFYLGATVAVSWLLLCLSACYPRERSEDALASTARLQLVDHFVNEKLSNVHIYELKYEHGAGVQNEPVILSGLDALEATNFRLLQKRSFALLANQSAKNRRLENILDLLVRHGQSPKRIFTPEHGYFGAVDTSNLSTDANPNEPNELNELNDSNEPGQQGLVDGRHGISIVSLYDTQRQINKDDVGDLDTIVIDLMNLPIRCYTYTSTIYSILERAQAWNLRVLILDRWHPYTSLAPAGSMLDPQYRSFVAMVDVPFLYGLSNAELALYLAVTEFPDLKLEIIKVPEIGAAAAAATSVTPVWLSPSPNIPSWESAMVYAGMVLFEGVLFSVGRGTTRPFIYSGAPWMRSPWQIVMALNRLHLPNVLFHQISFIPTFSKYQDQLNHGIQISPLIDMHTMWKEQAFSSDKSNKSNKSDKSSLFSPLEIAYEYMKILYQNEKEKKEATGNDGTKTQGKAGGNFKFETSEKYGYQIDRLWGGTGWRLAIEAGLSFAELRETWSQELTTFQEIAKPLQLYKR